MSNILATGMTWLSDQLAENVSDTVTYRRAAQHCSISATPGSSLLRVSDSAGAVRTLRTDKDFIFDAATLKLDGTNVTEPQRGDLIDVTGADSVTRRYEALPYGTNEPVFRYSDPERTIVRVHTKSKGIV